MTAKAQRAAWLLGTLGGVLASGTASSQATVDDLIEVEERRIAQAQEAQEEINSIVEETRDDFGEYQETLKTIETLQVSNILQQRLIDDQLRDLNEMRNEIANVQVIERQMLPLMDRMIRMLGRFIEADVPFLLEERRARVAALEDLLDDSDVTVPQKFRAVLEAWEIEIDYGTFNDEYTGSREINGVEREVSYLQIGRIAYLYLTPDGLVGGAWDQQNREWTVVDDETRAAISQGLELVRSGSTANARLLAIPVPPPEE